MGGSHPGRRLQEAPPSPSVAVQSGLWPALLTRMKIDPEAFITRHLDQIIPRITTQSPLNQVMRHTLVLDLGQDHWVWQNPSLMLVMV